MNEKRAKIARWLLAVVIVLELAVVDYCAVQLMSKGITIEVTSDGDDES